MIFFFFFFNDTATTEIYTLSLHDALPILAGHPPVLWRTHETWRRPGHPTYSLKDAIAELPRPCKRDRKSTRLNSSHLVISYAVFCLKKKKNEENPSGRTRTCAHQPTEDAD